MTCNTWLRALNAFCHWLHEQDDPPLRVRLAPQRLEKRLIRTDDETAIRAILSARRATYAHWPRLDRERFL